MKIKPNHTLAQNGKKISSYSDTTSKGTMPQVGNQKREDFLDFVNDNIFCVSVKSNNYNLILMN